MNIDVEADFLEDMRQEILGQLRELGYAPDAGSDLEKLSLQYFNVLHRLIQPQPRRVKRSQELEARGLEQAVSQVVDSIATRSTRGEDLRPFLSRRILEPNLYDPLLNDWGIHHLHLGSDVPEPDGFVKRRGELLYVMVRPDALYFIDILGHGADFANRVLLEIVHRNWPELIARFRAPPQVLSLNPDFTDEQRLRFRKGGLQTAIQLSDGTIYISPGGGYSSAGNSVTALTRGDYHRFLAHMTEVWCRENAAILQKEIQAARGVVVDRLKLHYQGVQDGKALVFETTTRVLFNIPIAG